MKPMRLSSGTKTFKRSGINTCWRVTVTKAALIGVLLALSLALVLRAPQPNIDPNGAKLATQLSIKTGRYCWAEINPQMAKGYELICGAKK